MNLDRLHEAALHQLTGCRYAVIHALHAALCESIPKAARGRPFKRTLWAQLVLTLIKLRLDLPYRTIEVMFRFDAVTAYRDVRRILVMLSALALKTSKGNALSRFLIVDSTGTRVRSTDLKDHSGHKHQKHFRVLSNLFPFHPDRYGEVFRAVAVIHNFKLQFK